MNYTKEKHEQYLNEVGEEMSLGDLQERYNIGNHVISHHNLGTFLRKYDPIQFEVSYQEKTGQ